MKVINLSGLKARAGETLRFLVEGPPPRVVLVSPGEAPRQVLAKKTSTGYLVEYSSTEREGLYVFTITSARRTLKRWFLVGDLVMDWVPASFALRDEGNRAGEVISAFSEVGNVVVAHSLCSWRGALYPSRGFPIEKGLESDPLDVILRTSQAKGVAVLFSYHWVPRRDVDMWVHPGPKEIASAKRMITELHALYSSYPSMAGF